MIVKNSKFFLKRRFRKSNRENKNFDKKRINTCKLDKKINLASVKLPINQWIFNEFIKTQNLVSKNIENFRFDEAAKHTYQFVWHSYCDWYLEFLKPVFNSNNKAEIKTFGTNSAALIAQEIGGGGGASSSSWWC